MANGRGTHRRYSRLTPLRITLVYLLVSVVWIVGSDWAVESLLGDAVNAVRLQTFKGLGFIFALGLLLYVLLSRADAERRRIDARLRESEARYRTLVETSPDGVFVQEGGKFVFVNDALARMLGASSATDLLKTPVLDRIHPDYHDIVRERMRRLHEEGVPAPPIEERFVRLDGSQVDVEVAAAPFTQEGKRGAQVVVRDITERILAERALRDREEQYRAVFESAADGLEIFDMQGALVDANPAACAMHGKPYEEFINLSPREFVHPSSWGQFDDFVKTVQEGRVYETRAWNMRADGSPYPIDVRGSGITYKGAPHILAIIRDVTEIVHAERRQALMMQELDHRVKNNLAAVLSLTEQSLAACDSLEAFRESFVGRVRALARTHAALASGKWEGVSLRELVEMTLAPYGDGKGRVRIEGEPVTLSPRAAMPMCMALHELATNAVKYGALGENGGEVSVMWRAALPEGRPTLHLEWRERGGPPVHQSDRRGFGIELIEGMIGYELGGVVRVERPPEGVICRIIAPLNEDDRVPRADPIDPSDVGPDAGASP